MAESIADEEIVVDSESVASNISQQSFSSLSPTLYDFMDYEFIVGERVDSTILYKR